MWNGKMKAVTFSYDDGITQDIRLIELLDRYGLRGTFNLNLGRQKETDTFRKSDIIVKHLNVCDLTKVYAGHEVAGHTDTHAHLELLDDDAAREEVRRCQDGLQQLFGRQMYGMAYPFGTYNDRTVEILAEENVRYSRTCIQTEGFEVPVDLLRLPTTCRHANSNLLTLAREFVELWRDIFAKTGGYFSPRQWFDTLNLGKTLKGVISAKESEEIIRRLGFKSFESEYKTMLIWLPETMNEEAANRILKILEEPWDKTIFILISERPDRLLKTIISRTQEVVVPRLTTEDLLPIALQSEPDSVKAQNIARLAAGDILELKRLLGQSEDEVTKENF